MNLHYHEKLVENYNKKLQEDYTKIKKNILSNIKLLINKQPEVHIFK